MNFVSICPLKSLKFEIAICNIAIVFSLVDKSAGFPTRRSWVQIQPGALNILYIIFFLDNLRVFLFQISHRVSFFSFSF